MKEMVPENFGKLKIDTIIKEEMFHIKLLSGKLVALKKQPEHSYPFFRTNLESRRVMIGSISL